MLALAVAGVAAVAAGAPAAPPAVVPALRDWRPAPGSFRLRADARVVLGPRGSRELRDEGRLLARDLGVRLGARGAGARSG